MAAMHTILDQGLPVRDGMIDLQELIRESLERTINEIMALRRRGVPVPAARHDLPQVPRRGARPIQGRRHRRRLRRRRLPQVRGLRLRRRGVGGVVEGVPARAAQARGVGRQVRRLRRARRAGPGDRRGLPRGGLAALHRPSRARRRRMFSNRADRARAMAAVKAVFAERDPRP